MNGDKKTLLILSPGFPKNENDSSCLPFLQNLLLELNELFPSLKIIVLAFDYPFSSETYLWKKNEVFCFNGWEKRYLKKLYKWFLVWRTLKKVHRNNNITGILSLWCGECAFLGNRFSKKNRIRHFCWLQGQDAKKDNRYVARIKPAATELLAISDFIQKTFENNHGIKPGHVVPIGIRPVEFLNEKPTRDIDILGVGSLIPLKQYELFIEVIHTLKENFPNIKAVLCGKGPEETKLKMLVEEYGLQNNIILTGELPHASILQYMNRSKVFIHTSNYEGLVNVCMEALYAGCKVISFVKPMNYNIENWNVVQTTEEMKAKTEAILNNTAIEFNSVLAFNMKETAIKIMQLYDYKEATIS